MLTAFARQPYRFPVLQLLNTMAGSLLPAVLFQKGLLLCHSQAIPIIVCTRAENMLMPPGLQLPQESP